MNMIKNIEILGYVLMIGIVLSTMYFLKDNMSLGNSNICIASKHYPSFGCGLNFKSGRD